MVIFHSYVNLQEAISNLSKLVELNAQYCISMSVFAILTAVTLFFFGLATVTGLV